MNSLKKILRRLGFRGVLWILLLVLIGVPILHTVVTGGGEPPPPTAEELAKAAEDKRLGLHCVDRFSGKHYGLEASVRDQLRDPKSYEHVETRIGAVTSEGEHPLVMTYRARNGFGGMNVARAAAVVDHESCELTKWTVLE